MPRILNLLNRNPSSQNYGSFDRDYWSYNSFDISNARKQEAVLTLALIYLIKRADNPYYNNEQILEWINAALEYAKKLQNKNGSFNEMYPNEHSFVATAFVSYAVSETLLLLKNKVKKMGGIIDCLKKSGDWLLENDENMALNQKAGSIIALHNIYLLTNNSKYKKGAMDKLTGLLNKQNKEGWFAEYDGADIGYLSLCIDYLAKYHKKTKDMRLLSSLKKASNFMQYFLLPGHHFGGEVGSRNTEYLIPYGFELLSGHVPSAALISRFIRESIKEKTALCPSTIDDRYLLFNGYTYLQAYIDGKMDIPKKDSLFSKNFTKYFDQSGIFVKNSSNFYMIANIKKGGVSRIIFKKKNACLNDGGSMIRLKNGKALGSNYLGGNDKASIGDNQVEIKRKFVEVNATSLTPLTFVLFRVFQLSLGRIGFISRAVRRYLRERLIRQKNQDSGISFSRRIILKKTELSITDEIGPLACLDCIMISSKLSFIFTESSRYFQLHDLQSKPFFIDGKMISKAADKKRIVLHRRYGHDGRLVHSGIS